MSKGKTISTILAVLVVNFAFFNILMSSRCSVGWQAETGKVKVPLDFATIRRKPAPARSPSLSDEVVLSYLKERQMSGTVQQMEKELQQRNRGATTNEQRQATESKVALAAAQAVDSARKVVSAEGISDAEIPLVTSSIAWSNLTTLGFYEGRLFSGFRNQIMCFTILILEALKDDHGQVLMDTVS
jgi:hypothetical protein